MLRLPFIISSRWAAGSKLIISCELARLNYGGGDMGWAARLNRALTHRGQQSRYCTQRVGGNRLHRDRAPLAVASPSHECCCAVSLVLGIARAGFWLDDVWLH